MSPARRPLLFLAVICLVLFSFKIGNRDFWNPDEPRYAGVTRAMLESGDWLLLRNAGEVYTHKPPLFFWLSSIAATAGGGLNETTARWVPCLAAVGCVLATFLLGAPLVGQRAAFFGALVLATSQRFFLEARWVHTDSLLALWVVLAMTGAHRALAGGRAGWLLMYAAMALACLTKGPVGVALPAAGVLVALASRRELGRLRSCGAWWGIPLALAPAAGWLALAARRAGFDPLAVLGKQVVQRVEEGLHHPRPMYYYLIALPLVFLPWTLFLPGALAHTLPWREEKRRGELLFLYGWLLGGLVLLSFSVEKRPSYLLPLLPALSLLAGSFLDAYLTRFDPGKLRGYLEIPLWAGGLACVAAAVWLPGFERRYPGSAARGVGLALAALVICVAVIAAIRAGRRGLAILILLGGVCALHLGIVGVVLPWLNGFKSARPFAARIVSRISGAPLGIYPDPNPAFDYYTARPLLLLRQPNEVEDFVASSDPGYCLMKESDFRALSKTIPLARIDAASLGHRTFVLAGQAPGSSGQAVASPR
ncbi:MAG TPA: glycosyltransferase family 39 protein [Candidatus Polarisedimenticolia bacterium]|nr:glycosyltransferase family 39 protein [Candidatus Polarisedimenticolia bacterium]